MMEIKFVRFRDGTEQNYYLTLPTQALSSDALQQLGNIRFVKNKGASSTQLMNEWGKKFGILPCTH